MSRAGGISSAAASSRQQEPLGYSLRMDELFPPPALLERRHRGLPRRLVAMRGASGVPAVGERL
jgi:hypothetical protein